VSRVALVSSEPLRPAMGGIGVRYLELARRLPAAGFDTVLVSPAAVDETAACGVPPERVRRFAAGRLGELLADRDVVVVQGQLGNDVVLAGLGLPVVVDLYDPWLVENLHYAGRLGLDPYRNDHASWVLQLALGDFFLCSSAEQRLYYLGFLTAVGRVNPRRLASDPTLERLIAAVPFGCEAPSEAPRPLLPAREPGERRILFGGVYDWYDVTTFLAALERLGSAEWRVVVVRHPNPEATPQDAFARLEREVRRRAGLAERVRFVDWVPAERRHDLLAGVDVLAAPHRGSFESELAFRTRFLDALAAGCPVVASRGGALARRIEEHRAGWVVPVGDAAALAAAIDEALAPGGEAAARVARGRELAAEFAWPRVLAPLVRFLAEPGIDPTKDEFAFRPATVAPSDSLAFRIGRRLRRLAGR
jgi:glycosyltransferase involved in cell wall biosynthesis